MLGRIALQSSRQGNAHFYHAYRQIKYQVFVIEQGWHTLADPNGRPVAIEDPFDDRGRFQLALSDEGRPIGIVRGVPLREGFPHRHLFAHHLPMDAFASALPMLCSINALAVLPAYRRQRYRVSGTDWEGSVGNLLVLGLLQSLAGEGIKGAVATAGSMASLRFFTRLGFKAIDPPAVTSLHPVPMTNIGMLCGSPAHRRTQATCRFDRGTRIASSATMRALGRYFTERQRHIPEGDLVERVAGDHAGRRDQEMVIA